MKKKYYSYSQLSTFKNCPQKYKIQYIDKVKNNNESIESFLGKRIHESLEWLYQKSKKDSFISFDIFDSSPSHCCVDYQKNLLISGMILGIQIFMKHITLIKKIKLF